MARPTSTSGPTTSRWICPWSWTEIQGNIVAGFNKDYISYLFFALPDEPGPSAQRGWLGLVDQVATSQEVKQFNDLFRVIRRRRGDREGVVEAAWMNLAFTHEGLGTFGVVDESDLDLFPEEFREGMRKRKVTIGDLGDNDPDRWPERPGQEDDPCPDDRRRRQRRGPQPGESVYFVRHAASHEVSLVFQQDGMTRR